MIEHGLAAFALVVLLRQSGWQREAVLAARKPWGCDPCMCGWSALLLLPSRWPVPWHTLPLVWLGAAGAALLLLVVYQSMAAPVPPGDLPP